MGYIDNDGKAVGCTGDLLNAKYDILSNTRMNEDIWRNEILIFTPTNLIFVTNKRQLTVSEYFLVTMSPILSMKLLICFISTAFIFAILAETSFLNSCLDVLRTLVGFSVLHVPMFGFRQLIFIFFIFIFMKFNFYTQSQLQSLMTAPAYEPPLKSQDELIKLNYSIYTEPRFQSYLKENPIENSVKYVRRIQKCLDNLTLIPKVACACHYQYMSFLLLNYSHEVYVLQDITTRFLTLVVRDDFFLKDKFSAIMTRLFESNIINYHNDKQNLDFLLLTKSFVRLNAFQDISSDRMISLYELEFNWYFLGIGLSVSSFVFVIELFVKYVYKITCS